MLAAPPRTALDLNWRMFGIPVRVHPYFWVISALLGSSSSDVSFQLVIVWVLVVLGSVLLHEFGHALTARYFGARHLEIILHSWGGLAVGADAPVLRQRILILLAGVGAELPVGLAAAAVLYSHVLPPDTPHLVVTLIGFIAFVNLSWALVNLLPVYPLDGGQVVVAVMHHRRPGDGFALAMRVSIGVAIAVVVALVMHLFFAAICFAYFAYLSFVNLQYGDHGDDAPRDDWSRPGDWWRR